MNHSNYNLRVKVRYIEMQNPIRMAQRDYGKSIDNHEQLHKSVAAAKS